MSKMGRRQKTEVEREFNTRLGMTVAELRKLKHVRVKDLAQAVGVSSSLISSYEAGSVAIPLFMLNAICLQLQVSVAEMVHSNTYSEFSRKRCARCLLSS